MAKRAKAALKVDGLEVVVDRGYYNGDQILDCHKASITVTLPKRHTSNNRAKGQFDRDDFRYVAAEDVYICPAGERMSRRENAGAIIPH